MNDKIIVTKHNSFVDYVVELGLAEKGTSVLTYVREKDVLGKHVIGVLPLRLASVAESITVINMKIPEEKRSRILSIEDIRAFASEPIVYKVDKVNK